MKTMYFLFTIPEESPGLTVTHSASALSYASTQGLELPNCVLSALWLCGLAGLIPSSKQRESAKEAVLKLLALCPFPLTGICPTFLSLGYCGHLFPLSHFLSINIGETSVPLSEFRLYLFHRGRSLN